MPTIDSTLSTLQQMIRDIRELTHSLSPAQLSDDRIKYWINTFVLYDFPASIRLKALRTVFEFYTTPYVDVYETNLTNPNDPFYNFRNKYITTHEPFYCAGYLGAFSQSREAFFGLYPMLANIYLITFGNNIQTRFTGVINALQSNQNQAGVNQINVCLIRNQVLFSSIDVNGNGLSMIDVPISATIGNLTVPNVPLVPPFDTTIDPNNFINYVTGRFVVTFTAAPASGQNVISQTVPVAPAMPQTLLWFDNKLTLRPVPNMPYKVSIEADIRPTELLNGPDEPKLAQWYQYIVYGAATKIFQFRMDSDSVDRIAPEFKRQELLCMRTTLVQNSKQRVPTIFSPTAGTNYGPGFGFFGNTF